MRPDIDTYFMSMAKLVSTRATCPRRSVGCVLVNSRNHIIATGYNGVPSGLPHCIEKPCSGADLPSGCGLDKCQALHAEQNALLQCGDVYSIQTAYITTAPCITCTKLFLNTSCKRIVFLDDYPHSQSKDLWESDNRQWNKFIKDLI